MADDLITEQLNNPSDNSGGIGIFKSALSALQQGRRTPNMPQDSSVMPPTTQKEFIEQQQQQFLDWQVSKINEDLYTRTLYYDTDRIAAFQDFRAMDMSPEISAALDILRDECLAADTVIPLLSGAHHFLPLILNSLFLFIDLICHTNLFLMIVLVADEKRRKTLNRRILKHMNNL